MEFWQLIAEIWENDIVLIFFLIIAAVFLLSVFGPHTGRLAALAGHGPTLCTTLGVLGTFTGIFLGLLEFDVAEIDASVPELLAGLKIAFSTSIVGLGAAVLLRIFAPMVRSRPDAESETTPEVIHQTLRHIDDTISQAADRQVTVLGELRNAISADSDSSLMTQTKMLRMSVEDGNREMISEFKQFAEKMAENNSQALIEALEKVIRDFNTQLNEQFGENFKELNRAVGALLEWQEQYRSHVETMEERIEAAVNALQTSEIALRAIATHAARIPDAFTELHKLLTGFTAAVETLQKSLQDHGAAAEELNAHLKAIADLKDRALEAFPTIEKNIELLTMHLTNTIESHTNIITNSAQDMQRQHQEQLRHVQQLIESEFQEFDQRMQQELVRVFELMGQQLASISEKFAEDYVPLTEKLRALLNAVERGTR